MYSFMVSPYVARAKEFLRIHNVAGKWDLQCHMAGKWDLQYTMAGD
jgi:hypothetical protein